MSSDSGRDEDFAAGLAAREDVLTMLLIVDHVGGRHLTRERGLPQAGPSACPQEQGHGDGGEDEETRSNGEREREALGERGVRTDILAQVLAATRGQADQYRQSHHAAELLNGLDYR